MSVIAIPTVEELLLAGAHFGHQTRRWNPKMTPYIYKVQSGVHIIDLFKTREGLIKAAEFLSSVAARGEQIIFVGTKGQAKEIMEARARECGSLFVTERWLGGTLTNFNEIRKRLTYLKDYYKKSETNAYASFTKKERLLLGREADKMQKVMGGILELRGNPGAVVIADPHREHIATKECLRLGVPVVAITDSNCDPTGIAYVIPANDDAIKSVDLIVSALAEAVRAGYGLDKPEESAKSDSQKIQKVRKSDNLPQIGGEQGERISSDLSSLDLSTRAFNALNKAGITTVAELKKADLGTIKGLGAKSIKEIKKAIK